MTTAIKIENMNKSFHSGPTVSHVLHDINLTLPTGEVILIVGPSGCGKTTLISIIGGILNADDGEVTVFGQSMVKMNGRDKTEFRKKYIGFIFQQFNLIPTLTVQENAAIPLLIQGVNRETALDKSKELLGSVGLGDRLESSPVKLSGGQQQRVAIARALIRDPKLVICDEPTASLDGPTGRKIMETLRTLATQTDRCVLVVTHDSRVFEFGDRMVKMEDGRVIAEGKTLEGNIHV